MEKSADDSLAVKRSALPPLWTKGFVALLITQFMVALNDNIFRWLIIPIGKCAIGWSDRPDAIRTIGSLAFLLPFLLLATYAGYVCDRFNRRSVLIWCKVAEVIVMILGACAIVSQSVPFMLVTLFLMASQSAFFSPAKYGSLPNLVPEERISEANGFVSMTTMVACIGGQVLGGVLFVLTTLSPEAPVEGSGGMNNWFIWASVLIGVAIAGLISSFFIPSIQAADPKAKFPLNPFSQTFKDLRFLFQKRFIFWIALASSFFWGLGALAQVNIDKFATEYLHVRQDYAMALLVALSLGLALGALLAGKLSRGRIELGLVPIGAVLIVVFCVVLSFTPGVVVPEGLKVASPYAFGFIFGALGLLGLGLSAGMYDIPLLATLQTKSPPESRGRILAAYNFYSFAAMAIFSVVQGLLAAPPFLNKGQAIADESADAVVQTATVQTATAGLSASQIWLVCGLVSLPVLYFATRAFFIPLVRICIGYWLRLTYRLRDYGVDNIPAEGAVLLVGNHFTFLDALIVYCTSKRPVRFIADEATLPLKSKLASYVLRQTGVIQFKIGVRKSAVSMIRQAQEALQKGEVVGIFPEGALTRDGQVRAFKNGFLAILRKTPEVPIIPFAISGFYGSRFAYAKPKWYKGKSPYRPTVVYGAPFSYAEAIAEGNTEAHISQRLLHIVQELSVDVCDYRKHPENVRFLTPARATIRSCRKIKNELRLADSTGKKLTSRQTLLQMLVLRRVLHRLLGSERYVGVLLPTSVAGVLINGALGFDRRVPVNLNYTFTNEVNNYCLNMVGIKKVLASAQLLKKLPKLQLNAELLILEELAKKELRTSDKLIGFVESLLPACVLDRVLGLTKQKLSDVNTVVFTSGSTGMPKGTVLTNGNVMANAQSFGQGAMPRRNERLCGTLPFFHSFGYTVTVWFPLVRPYSCVYHYNPLDYRGVADIVKKHKPTILISTPTFLRTYLRKCSPEDFASLDFVVPGAEKTPKDLIASWREKFGYGLNEGFGATELSPVLSFNLPVHLAPDPYSPYHKDGSIGRACPNFVAKTIDMTTGKETAPNEPGMLLVKGNSVTVGYYDDPAKTEKIFKDGWYVTGDVARIDEDNFIFITGRETRMSKIGGEMAPHELIEEKLLEVVLQIRKEKAIDLETDAPTGPQLAVTAVPDEKKGEKLVVLYVDLPETSEEICKRATALGSLPQIWIPATVNFKQVDAIPVLGTGKLNLREIKALALKIYGLEESL